MEASQRERLQESLSSLSRGDREAFTTVFDILWPIYRRFARRQLPEGDADDAAQEALLKLFVRANEFDTSRDAAAFAIGVAFHEIRTWRRKKYRRREDAENVVESSRPPEQDAALAVREADELIEWGLARLSAADREALTLYAHDERAKGATGAAFRKRVQRALERCRAIMRLR
ncbi:MAG: RNA polymerase sigma factor [Vicinamibacteria bacterium]|nr:RNA polymerase sigma factor [Vicinamibacteria bacterium]MBP9945034.1 RNA polymerase sigma factor [Vicinamibacteria bacterium]